MAIQSTDLVAYAAASMPQDETSTAGGVIDPTTRIIFTDLAAPDTIEVLSSNGADAMNITVVARKTSGVTVTQTVAINGSTPVAFSTLGTIERVLSATIASNALGTVTVRRVTGSIVIGAIPTTERGFQRLFINAYSDLSVGKNYYMKFFWKNTNGSLALTTALVKQATSGDPSGLITHALAGSVNDSATVANRLTAPGGLTFNDSDKAVPGVDLAAGDAIGTWLLMALAQSQAPVKSTYTSQLFGLST